MTWAAKRGAAAWQHDGTARRHAVARTSDASVVRTGASDTFPRVAPAVTATVSVFDVAARKRPDPAPRQQTPSDRPGVVETPRPRRGGDHMRRRRGPAGRAARLTLLAAGLTLAAVSLAGFTGRSLAEADSANRPEPAAGPDAASAPAPTEPETAPAAGVQTSGGDQAAQTALPERLATAAAPAATTPTPVTDQGAIATVGGGYEVRLEVGATNGGETAGSRVADLTVAISRAGESAPALEGEPVRLVTVREGSLAYQEAAPPDVTEDGVLRFRPDLDPGTYQVLVQFSDRASTPRVAAFTLELE